MLLKFSVENYRSFGREMTLDLYASNGITDLPGKGVSVIGSGPSSIKVLNALSLYGANSSGKSNLLQAIRAMRHMVLNSVRLNEGDSLDYDPFVLSTRAPKPTHFEITYYDPATRGIYTYGFEYTEVEIVKEWLLAKWPGRSEKRLIDRTPERIELDPVNFEEGVRAHDTLVLNKNRLFLSLAGQAGGEISNRVITWFQRSLSVISGIHDTTSSYTRKRVADSPETKSRVQEFICKMNLGFERFDAEKVDFESIPGFPKELIERYKRDPFIQIHSAHNVYDENGAVVRTEMLDLDSQESAGTNKVFALSAPLLEALDEGMTLVVDELDSKMHPLLSRRLVEMFNNPKENPHSAQLIFTTHDTNLLSNDVLRRDQIWFTEKDSVENTGIYSLLKVHERSVKLNHAPRKDSNYQKNYIQGLYGAVPWITSEKPKGC